jgi:hypothetical protein
MLQYIVLLHIAILASNLGLKLHTTVSETGMHHSSTCFLTEGLIFAIG